MSIRKRTWKSRGVDRTAWVCDYFDQSGKRRLKTFATKKEADAWVVTARHEVRQGTHTPASVSVTVTEAMERWLANCEADGLEFGTVRQRRQHMKHHIAPFIGGVKLSALTTPRVHQFDAELRDGGRSLAMRRKVITSLKTMLTFAQSQGLVAQNVARSVRIKVDRQASTGRPLREGEDYPTKAEIRTLLDKAPDRWRAFIVVAIFTGLRASELRGLRWDDVDLERALLHVRQRADAWRKMGPPKSKAGEREMPLVPMAVNALRQWQLVCPKGVLGLVFPNQSGNVETHSNLVGRFWAPYQVSCGICVDGRAKYGLHALRHAAASIFIAHLNWTPKRIQSIMGHASITLTFDRYGHLFADREGDQEAMKKLEAAVIAA
jgi:integrase